MSKLIVGVIILVGVVEMCIRDKFKEGESEFQL